MATLTFPPAHIEQAVVAPVTTYTRRIDVLESDGSTMFARNIGFEGGSIKVRLGNPERRTADLRLVNNDGRLDVDRLNGFWYDKVIKVYMGVVSSTGAWEQCVGTFLPDRIGNQDQSGRVAVTCRDFSKKLSRKLPFALAWDENTPIDRVITDMAEGGGIFSSGYNIPPSTVSLVEPRSFSAGADRWSSMRSVAEAFGQELFFDEDGILTMEPFTDPFTSQPQYTFQVGEFSNLSKIDREISDSFIVNHWVVTGEDIDGDPIWGEAFNYESESPTNVNRLGLRTDTFDSPWVTTFDQAEELAQNKLKLSSLERYECNVQAVIVPWLDVNVTVNFDDPAAAPGDPIRYLLAEFDLDLGLGPSNVDLRRVTDVIDADAFYPDLAVYPSTDVTWPNLGN